MSDQEVILTKEEKIQAVLEKIRVELLDILIWSGIGWTLIFFALTAPHFQSGWWTALFGIGGVFIFTKSIREGNLKGFFFWQDYEIVTTYSDGSKSSDAGMTSLVSNIIYWAFALTLGVILVPVKLTFLIIKYTIYFLMAKEKPAFLQSGFFIVIIGIAVIFLGIIIPGSINNFRSGAPERKLNREAEIVKMDVMADNGIPLEITEIRYRSDATIIFITETEKDAITMDAIEDAQIFNRGFYNGGGFHFQITAPSGTYSLLPGSGSVSSVRNRKDEWIGVRIEFPPEMKDTSFTLTELRRVDISEAPEDVAAEVTANAAERGIDVSQIPVYLPTADSIRFTNVTVKK